MFADSKTIRLVTALVECRPDGEYVPWGIKWYRRRRLSIQRDRIVHSALLSTGGGREYVHAAVVEALDVSGHAEKIGPGTSEYELIEVR